MRHFIDKISGKADAEIIDVYEALDMFLPGLLAFPFQKRIQEGVDFFPALFGKG